MKPYDYYITDEEYKIAEENGICRRTLTDRIRKYGWDKKRAMEEKPKPKRNISKWVNIAKKNGINRNAFDQRINSLKWDFEKAATTPVLSKDEVVENVHNHNRKFSSEMLELAEKNGIKYKTFVKRVSRMKMTELEAATVPTKTHEEVTRLANIAYRKNRKICHSEFGNTGHL